MRIGLIPALLSIGLAGPFEEIEGQTSSPDLRIGQDVHVSAPAATVPHIEPHLAIHPSDPERLVVAARVVPPEADAPLLRVYGSADGGRTWTAGQLARGDRAGDDPWLAYSPDGALHLLSLPGALRTSRDDGLTWGPPEPLPQGDDNPYDYPKLVVEPGTGAIYLWSAQTRDAPWGTRIGAAVLLRSLGGQAPFETPRPVFVGDLDLQVGAPAILPDGALVAPLHELGHDQAFLESPRLWVVRFEKGGSGPTGPFLVSEDFLADSPDAAVDASGGLHHGRVYLAWLQVSADRQTWNQYVSHSDDRGTTWSSPQPIYAGAPSAPSYVPHHPEIAVDGRGRVALTWQEPREGPGERCFALVVALSADGGATYTAPAQVADVESCNDTPANRVGLTSAPDSRSVVHRFGDGGDYHGLVGRPDGGFSVVWADSRTGVYQLWSAAVGVIDGNH